MKVIGKKIKDMGEVTKYILMEIPIMVGFKMEKLMDMEFTSGQMVRSTMGSGKKE